MAEKIEYTTLLNSKPQLGIGFKFDMTRLAGSFHAVGLIDDECNEDVTAPRSIFNASQKTDMMAGRILDKVSINSDNYHKMMEILSKNQKAYGDLLKTLDEMYKSLGKFFS